MLQSSEFLFTSTTSVVHPSYDSTKVTRGSLMSITTGIKANGNHAGPFEVAMVRSYEALAQGLQVSDFPHVLSWSSNIDWIFLGSAASNTTHAVGLVEFDKTRNVFTAKGFVTLTYPTATTHTTRGFRAAVDTYTAGTASVSGTSVTGVATAWSASRLAVGGRMGFGSTDPAAINTWYVISAIGSDTSITLSASAGTISAGAYVIEEIRIILANTNGTATNGGLYVVKGLNYGDFTHAGTTIPAAVSTDNIKAVYFLGDSASTQSNTTSCGLGLEDRESWTAHTAYVIDGVVTPRVWKYNTRAALTGFASGKSGSAFLLSSGTQSVTGTLTQQRNATVAKLGHGVASGTNVNSLFFTTSSRVYRAVLSGITSGSTAWISDSINVIPPGGTNTFPASNLGNVEKIDTLDRLFINSSSGPDRSYITKYDASNPSNEYDEILMADSKQTPSTLAYNIVNIPTIHSVGSVPMGSSTINGRSYVALGTTSTNISQLFALPLGADWNYASGTTGSTGQRLITPEISTPNVTKYQKVYVNHVRHVGDLNYGVTPDAFRTYYRPSGITDNSGTWTLVDDTGDISESPSATSIQFMFEFKTISAFCYPGRIIGVNVTYEDTSTDSHYEPSVGNSDLTNKRFAWRFIRAFQKTVPTLKVRLYNSVTGALLVTDNTANPTGTFEKSTNGGTSWSAYDMLDKTNDNTYIRYTPTALADDIKVSMLLTLN